MRDFKQAYLFTLALVLFTALGFSGGVLLSPRLQLAGGEWPILHQAYQILVDNGFKPAPQSPGLEYGMIRGMVQAYDDPYTQFVEPIVSHRSNR